MPSHIIPDCSQLLFLTQSTNASHQNDASTTNTPSSLHLIQLLTILPSHLPTSPTLKLKLWPTKSLSLPKNSFTHGVIPGHCHSQQPSKWFPKVQVPSTYITKTCWPSPQNWFCATWSMFATQETNVHWDAATSYHLYNQCHWASHYLAIVTSTSMELAQDWYKPGGTMIGSLDQQNNYVPSQTRTGPLVIPQIHAWANKINRSLYYKDIGSVTRCLMPQPAQHPHSKHVCCRPKESWIPNCTSYSSMTLFNKLNNDMLLTKKSYVWTPMSPFLMTLKCLYPACLRKLIQLVCIIIITLASASSQCTKEGPMSLILLLGALLLWQH